MLKVLPLLVFFSIPFISVAQVGPVIQWQYTWGSSGEDGAHVIKPTNDGGYIVAGRAWGNNGDVIGYHGGAGDVWVLKLDVTGTVEWQRVYGGSGADYAQDIKQTSDGGYIVAASTTSNNGDVTGNHGDWDAWLIKLDVQGDIQWQRCYGGSGNDGARSVLQAQDGGYVLAATTSSNDGDVSGNHGSADYRVVKLDANANIEWQKTLGGSGYDEAAVLQETADGGYILTGGTTSVDGDVSEPASATDGWTVKLDIDGNIMWDRSLGGDSDDYMYSLKQTTDHGYVIAGIVSGDSFGCPTNYFYAYVAKLNAIGELEWQVPCMGGSASDFINDVIQTPDGGFVIVGSTESTDGDVSFNHGMRDGWLVRLDPEGNLLWERTLGGSLNDAIYSIAITSDGGYIVAGATASSDGDVTENKGQTDLWVVKLGPDPVGIAEQEPQATFSLSPNPASEVVNIHFEKALSAGAQLKLMDAQGRHVATPHEGKAVAAGSEMQFSVGHLPAGMYAVQLSKGDGTWTQRFVKQ